MYGYFDHCYECVYVLLCSLITLFFPFCFHSQRKTWSSPWGPTLVQRVSACVRLRAKSSWTLVTFSCLPAEFRPHCAIWAAGVNKHKVKKGWTSRKRDMGRCDAEGQVTYTNDLHHAPVPGTGLLFISISPFISPNIHINIQLSEPGFFFLCNF